MYSIIRYCATVDTGISHAADCLGGHKDHGRSPCRQIRDGYPIKGGQAGASRIHRKSQTKTGIPRRVFLRTVK